MATVYESIVRVRCDPHGGAAREEVLAALAQELGEGQFLFRAEEDAAELSVTAQVVADDASLAQRQAAHVVTEALVRAGVEAGTRVEDTEIRASS